MARLLLTPPQQKPPLAAELVIDFANAIQRNANIGYVGGLPHCGLFGRDDSAVRENGQLQVASARLTQNIKGARMDERFAAGKDEDGRFQFRNLANQQNRHLPAQFIWRSVELYLGTAIPTGPGNFAKGQKRPLVEAIINHSENRQRVEIQHRHAHVIDKRRHPPPAKPGLCNTVSITIFLQFLPTHVTTGVHAKISAA